MRGIASLRTHQIETKRLIVDMEEKAHIQQHRIDLMASMDGMTNYRIATFARSLEFNVDSGAEREEKQI